MSKGAHLACAMMLHHVLAAILYACMITCTLILPQYQPSPPPNHSLQAHFSKASPCVLTLCE
jgi:energy-converting hydrogenase Eha subunit A